MSVGSHLSDFVGYDVGVPHVVPPATVGYVGFLDFVGFPVGLGATPPVPPAPVRRIGAGPQQGVRIDGRRRKKLREDEEILILS